MRIKYAYFEKDPYLTCPFKISGRNGTEDLDLTSRIL
jgi:hypothetical protein